MADITIPIYMRIGGGSENQIGEVTATTLDDANAQLAALLREAANELDQLGQGVSDGG
jgi:hypothetical protein